MEMKYRHTPTAFCGQMVVAKDRAMRACCFGLSVRACEDNPRNGAAAAGNWLASAMIRLMMPSLGDNSARYAYASLEATYFAVFTRDARRRFLAIKALKKRRRGKSLFLSSPSSAHTPFADFRFELGAACDIA